tara:strand:- start:109 stop:1086 length:978 start_codon:yes stop_codon:yes gene_type:complete
MPSKWNKVLIGAFAVFTACAAPDEDFTIILLPDTQFYTAAMNGGSPEIFEAQTHWIVENRDLLNIAFVTHVGDFVQHGDSILEEWEAGHRAMSLLEDPTTTGLRDGIPYGVAVGNHEQSPWGDSEGTTELFNRFFGVSRFEGRSYYGGHFGATNDNHYELFSAGRLDFIVLHLEYDPSPDPAILAWADALLKEYQTRRAIVVTHYMVGPGNPAEFGPQGQAIYDALKGNPNLFLLLGGHIPGDGGEGQRVDRFEGRTVYSLLSDYQARDRGGNGWLRIMRFSPASGEITVKTFSPFVEEGRGAFETDESSQFVLSYDMSSSSPDS